MVIKMKSKVTQQWFKLITIEDETNALLRTAIMQQVDAMLAKDVDGVYLTLQSLDGLNITVDTLSLSNGVVHARQEVFEAPVVGYKLVDQHGGNSVVVDICHDEDDIKGMTD